MKQNENELPQYLKEYKEYLEGRPLAELKQIYSYMEKSSESEKAGILRQHIQAVEAGEALEPAATEFGKSIDPELFNDAEVLEQIRNPSGQKSTVGSNLILLVVSLMIFAGTGLFEWKPVDLGILIVVLLVHELGHMLAMKAFKYRDVKMFFLPLIGAAVSAKEGTPYESRKALVSLLGPFPGILIGLGLAILYGFSKEPLLFQASTLFVYINAFNLLPFYPLDGGRFLESVLFGRHFVIETIFKVVTSLLLALLAVSIQAWLLLILPAGILLSLRQSYHASKAANKLRSGFALGNTGDLSLSEDFIRRIRESFSEKAGTSIKNVKHLAALVENTWNRVYSIKPKLLKTGLLLGTYGIAVLFSLATAWALLGIRELSKYDNRLAQELNADSTLVYVQKTYRDSILVSKMELDSDGFFHGSHIAYEADGKTLENTGRWRHGKRHGDWTFYDSLSKPYKITTFDNGKFVIQKMLEGGEWNVKDWNNLSKLDQTTFSLHHEGNPERSPAWLKENQSRAAMRQ